MKEPIRCWTCGHVPPPIRWENLNVRDGDGCPIGSLLDVVTQSPDILLMATVRGGKIIQWPDYYISADDEIPDWDTPRGDINWTGFTEALYPKLEKILITANNKNK